MRGGGKAERRSERGARRVRRAKPSKSATRTTGRATHRRARRARSIDRFAVRGRPIAPQRRLARAVDRAPRSDSPCTRPANRPLCGDRRASHGSERAGDEMHRTGRDGCHSTSRKRTKRTRPRERTETRREQRRIRASASCALLPPFCLLSRELRKGQHQVSDFEQSLRVLRGCLGRQGMRDEQQRAVRLRQPPLERPPLEKQARTASLQTLSGNGREA